MALLVGGVPSALQADPIITIGPGGGNPAENLLFNDPNLIIGPATLIQGVTNNSDRVLDITSTASLVGNGGQARIEGAGGALFGAAGVTLTPHSANDLPVGLFPMSSFNDIKFNIDANADGTVSFSVTTNLGTFLFAGLLDGTGENFFRFTTTGSEVITGLTITTDTNNIKDIQQIRLGGVTGPGGGGGGGGGGDPVPEPASMLLWGIGALGALGVGVIRRRRKVVAA